MRILLALVALLALAVSVQASHNWYSFNDFPGGARVRSAYTSGLGPRGFTSYLVGGQSATSTLLNDVWASYNNGANWTRLATAPGFAPRADAALTWVGASATSAGTLFLIGGNTNLQSINGKQNDVWSSTDGGATWTRVVQQQAFSPRSGHSVVSTVKADGSSWIYIVGAGGSSFNDVWVSSTSFAADSLGSSWQSVELATGTTPQFPGRSYAGLTYMNNQLVLFGGLTPQFVGLNDVWSSSDDGNTWSSVATAPWAPRGAFGYSYDNTNKTLYLVGGSDFTSSNRQTYNDAWNTVNGAVWTRSRIPQFSPLNDVAVFADNQVVTAVTGRYNGTVTANVYQLNPNNPFNTTTATTSSSTGAAPATSSSSSTGAAPVTSSSSSSTGASPVTSSSSTGTTSATSSSSSSTSSAPVASSSSSTGAAAPSSSTASTPVSSSSTGAAPVSSSSTAVASSSTAAAPSSSTATTPASSSSTGAAPVSSSSTAAISSSTAAVSSSTAAVSSSTAAVSSSTAAVSSSTAAVSSSTAAVSSSTAAVSSSTAAVSSSTAAVRSSSSTAAVSSSTATVSSSSTASSQPSSSTAVTPSVSSSSTGSQGGVASSSTGSDAVKTSSSTAAAQAVNGSNARFTASPLAILLAFALLAVSQLL